MVRLSLLCTFLFLSLPIFAEEGERSGAPKTREEFLNRLVEEHQDLYQSCQKDEPNNVANCLWEEIPDDKKEAIQKALKTYKSEDEKEVAKEYTGVDVSSGLDNLKRLNNTPGGEKIKEYFKNKLMEALLGEKANGKGVEKKYIADHKVFYDLYQNRVSKNLIEAMSSYCIEAVPVTVSTNKRKFTTFVIPAESKREAVREKYIDMLGKLTASANEDKKGAKAYKIWSQCISQIQNTCEQKMQTATCQKATVDSRFSDLTSSNCDDIEKLDEKSLTVQRACTVSEYMTGARQALMRIQGIKEKWKKLNPDGETAVFEDVQNAPDFYRRDDEKNNINSLTTLSSKEVVKDSGYKEGMAKKKETANACAKGDLEIQSDECQQFLAGKKEELEKELTEYEVRSKAMLEKLKGLDKKGQKKLLKEEGFSEDRIGELVKGDPEELTGKISERYKKKREALVESLRKQVDEKTVAKESSKEEKFGSISKQLEEDSNRLRDLVHFNNVVSGYLEVKGRDGKTYRNTASLYKEIESIEDSDSSDAFKESVDRLRETAKKSELKKTDAQETQNATLDVEQLNDQFLDY